MNEIKRVVKETVVIKTRRGGVVLRYFGRLLNTVVITR